LQGNGIVRTTDGVPCQFSIRGPGLTIGDGYTGVMTRSVSALSAAVGPILVGTLVAAGLALVGLRPLLGVVAGLVVAVDLRYYRALASGDGTTWPPAVESNG
jgi:hypothetical protein